MTLDVLVERYNADRGTVSGRSTQNKLVHFDAGEESSARKLVGQTVPVKVHKAFPNNFRGELLSQSGLA